ncbi:MAG TPA: hypothetical protein VK364_06465, partial [Hymenobacter sp.]|nr:hypothetical protein [Hymenobacter sp.]
MNKTLWLTLIALLLAGSAYAQDTTLTRLIQKNRYPLELRGPEPTGTGWDKLRESIQKSQFVLVGEEHGIAQIPVFTGAVAQVLKPAAFVAEIDTYQMQELTHLTAQPGPPTAYLKQHPYALSFYSWTEEYELARQLRAQNVQLIGVEQVNFFSIGSFYSQLATLAKNKQAKAYLQARATAYQAFDLAAMRQGKSDWAMFTQKQSAIDSLL